MRTTLFIPKALFVKFTAELEIYAQNEHDGTTYLLAPNVYACESDGSCWLVSEIEEVSPGCEQ